jgi:hypothetical protein
MKSHLGVLGLVLLAASGSAETAATSWNGLPDRFQIDTGYFRLRSDTVLRLNGEQDASGDVNLEDDLGVNDQVDTFWVDATWRVGRRHQLKLGFTRFSRERANFELQRDFVWGGETYNAGLSATTTNSNTILGGYYRFALYRSDRFEIGPSLGIGYLSIEARIEATRTVTGPGGSPSRNLDRGSSIDSPTGAIGGYAEVWPARRLVLRGDAQYIKATLDDADAAVTDWRLAANYYFFTNAGLGVQYKFNRYSYDRGLESAKLGGEVTFQGLQVYLSFRF